MRYFLIDRVTELVPGERARGLKNVTLSDEVLHDHFPDYPIMPGVLILEAAAQLAGFLLESSFNKEGRPPLRALLVQVQQAKFHDTCGPGDRLELLVRLASKLDASGANGSMPPAAQVSAEVTVEGKRMVRAELTFIMKDIPSERVHEQRRYLYKLWTKDLAPAPAIL